MNAAEILRWAGRTDTGRTREANQDSLLLADGFFAVADGMGGHRGGEVASAVTVETLSRLWPAADVDTLLYGVAMANEAVLDHAAGDPRLTGMGTTLAGVALIAGPPAELVVVNVGDSRVYRFADGALRQVTQDHSLVETLVREGQLSPEQAVDHPQRNIVTRALGVSTPVEVDYWRVPIRARDRYLLCSDGLSNEVTDDEIARACTVFDDPQTVADKLVDLANSRGSRDNVSVVVVDVLDHLESPDVDIPVEPMVAVPRVARHDVTAEQPAVVVADPAPDAAPMAPMAIDDSPPLPGAAAPDATAVHHFGADPGAVAAPAPLAPATAAPAAAAEFPVDPTGTFDPPASTHRGAGMARNLIFVVIVLALIALAAGLVAYYARANYFVAFDGDQVVVQQGRPGGVLWFDPTVELRTQLAREDLVEPAATLVEGEPEFGSLEAAADFVANLTRAGGATTTDAAPTPTPDT